MPFKLQPQTALLEFEEGHRLGPWTDEETGERHPGVLVRVSLDMSLDDFLAMQRQAQEVEGASEDENQARATLAFERFGDEVLIGWGDSPELDGLEWGGEVLPATGASMKKLPMPVATDLMHAYNAAATGPGEGSASDSTNGATSGAESTEAVPV